MARRRKPPTFKQVQRELADVMEMLRHYVLAPFEAGREVDPQEVSRLTTAYVQTVQTYVKVEGVADVQPQLDELKEELRELRQESLRA